MAGPYIEGVTMPELMSRVQPAQTLMLGFWPTQTLMLEFWSMTISCH